MSGKSLSALESSVFLRTWPNARCLPFFDAIFSGFSSGVQADFLTGRMVWSSLALCFRDGPGSSYVSASPTKPTLTALSLTSTTASSSLESETKMYLAFFFLGTALLLVVQKMGVESLLLLMMIGSSSIDNASLRMISLAVDGDHITFCSLDFVSYAPLYPHGSLAGREVGWSVMINSTINIHLLGLCVATIRRRGGTNDYWLFRVTKGL